MLPWFPTFGPKACWADILERAAPVTPRTMLTGEFFEIERDWTNGAMSSCAGRYGLDDFGLPLARELRAGLEGM
jgi:hypothetical protein